MANPAPTINQINAFNATQGTIIDFNIIGGTELVRSNRIYIYDLSDNSLICTHLYVSTESIHELPANTDSSIIYESGKSSADFVNGAQYYAQIQTFTDTAGTEGGSGLSVAKMFWCLVDPTLTITTIPSTISTTSYNVSATYNANTSVVSNIIQQYQFNLYSATGSLLQSSGVVVGNGEQQGTSTTYDISYNFSGLSVGSSYYVTVDVTTTQGMSVSAQSNTFTVSIETPTLGEATVVNNACDGYISVTSNLSGEYGGSASGEIATFVTDSVNDVSSLKVTLTPQQDGTPWIGTDHDTTPYLHRAMPTQSNAYNRESGVIVGGTVGWNQLLPTISTDGWEGEQQSSLSISGTTIDVTCSSGDINVYNPAIRPKNLISFVTGHKYLCSLKFKSTKAGYPYYRNSAFGSSFPLGTALTEANTWKTYEAVANATSTVDWRGYFGQGNATSAGLTYDDVISFKDIVLIDLTAMFGSTIADYIYSLEQANAGAGVAWFRKYFPEDYYPYSQPTLQSVQATAHKTYDGDGNVIGNYALDSNLTLRGIPKLDASNNLYYDGDTYASDGTVTRNTIYRAYQSGDESLANAITDGTNTVVYSANASTETAQAYTNPQVVDPDGTEEYVTANYVPVGHDSTYSLVCPISGYDEVSANVTGVNVWDEEWEVGGLAWATGQPVAVTDRYRSKNFCGCKPNTAYYGDKSFSIFFYDEEKNFISYDGFYHSVVTTPQNCHYFKITDSSSATYNNDISINYPSTDHDYHSGTSNATYTADLGQTVYGGTVDLVSGELVIDRAMFEGQDATWTASFSTVGRFIRTMPESLAMLVGKPATSSHFPTANNSLATTKGVYVNSTRQLLVTQDNITTIADWNAFLQSNKASGTPVQFTVPLATPRTIQLTPQEIQTLVGTNNVWSDSGDVEITYNIPITNLLVKRQDVADVSGSWLTLYSQPVTQASDMDFTFIDFLNQYGKTYKYALVPLLTQTQSGVEVEVEGGYTVSDEVQSIFDGVFIADSTGSQKCKANVGYGDVDMNQAVGTITPIGAKYPVVITNSKNQYHNGSITGTIVPDDYYFNGNLSRIDMVNKRNELEQFLTNKRAKIIKDWNGNTWLVMIMDNINCTFNNEYGMGIVNFTANWIEVGDPTNQQDLQATGLIDVGGA